jgi:hypothetical protein
MNWKKYSESLVKRGEILLDFDVIDKWDNELEEMNKDKEGRKFVYPDSFIKLLGYMRAYFHLPYSLTRNTIYDVTLLEQTWVCSCPDFQFREVEFCKHIHATKTWIASKHVKEEPKPKIFADDSIQCDKCGSIRVYKYGKYGDKQVFKCKDY